MPAASNTEEVIKSIIDLYTKYFGSTMAKSYKEFYAGKDLNTILISASELFVEYAGETKGKEILKVIYITYHIQSN
jgi:hypothetical protein